MMDIVSLDATKIENEHICCAISDKKCSEGYLLKKDWLKRELANGYIFRRIDARAKVFIEYGPAEKGWAPLHAPNYLLINCFWVSGHYKGQGYGKKLLALAIEDAKAQGKDGLVTIAGLTKLPFMSDTKWLIKQGFKVCDTTESGFCVLVYHLNETGVTPQLHEKAKKMAGVHQKGIVVYYSNRCPFTEYHVRTSLTETANKRQLPLEIRQLKTMEEAQSAPTPATIFSLFVNGQFISTDISSCMDSRFDKIVAKSKIDESI